MVLVPPVFQEDCGAGSAARGGAAEAEDLARGPLAPGPLGRGGFRELFGAYFRPVHAAALRARAPAEGLEVAAAVRSGSGSGAGAGAGAEASGSGGAEVVWRPALRPGGALSSPHTFLAVAAEAGRGGWSAVRGCAHSPAAGLAIFGTLPLYLAPEKGLCTGPGLGIWERGERPRGAALGARLGSDDIAVGFQLDPAAQANGKVWASAQARRLTAAVECDVGPRALGGLAEGAAGGRGARSLPELSLARLPELWRSAPGRENLRAAASYTAFGGVVGEGHRPELTVACEYNRGSSLRFGILTHYSVRRKVRNIFEDPSVVGIANYVELGLLLETPLEPAKDGRPGGEGDGGAPSSTGPDLAIAASLQMNEGTLMKCCAGSEGVRAALALRSWWSPSLTASATAHWAWGAAEPRYTFAISVDTAGGEAAYERPDPHQTFGAPTQKHAASDLEIAAGAADPRPLVELYPTPPSR